MKDREEYISILEVENAELKKQVEEYRLDIINGEPYVKLSCMTNQQQEFIKYLKQCIENEKYCYMAEKQEDRVRKDILKEILSKYKEIVGDIEDE